MLVLNFNICESCDCKSISFTDTTGIYDISDNSTGYGTPNPEISDTTNSTLLIKTPSNSSGFSITLFPTFPTVNSNTKRIITSSDLNLSANLSLEDGLYTFIYSITTTSGVFTQTKEIFLYCNIKCCVNRMFNDLEITECEDCQKKKLNNANLADIFLEVIKRNAECGNKDKFNNTLKLLQNLCGSHDCSTCQ